MTETTASLNFIEQIVTKDIEENKHDGKVITRFPPEPNGYLHLGHAASICLNFQTADRFGGKTNLRFDDTNPAKEEQEYVDAIQRDIKWLGFQWDGDVKFTSDYFDQLHTYAVQLIENGLAYVDDSSQEEIREMRGVPTRPGTESPFRERTVEENLKLFKAMVDGEYSEGEKVLRAKVDMTSPNMHMRDPIIYRILKAHHHRTGDKWNVYPMYDFAHGNSDSIEGITHSVCTLEFEEHRPLYDWFIEKLGIFPSKQYEFGRVNVNYTVMSKRKLLSLVNEGHVNGWDDPRMPTISGMRRRGYTADAIKNFCSKAGIGRINKTNDVSLLEFALREDLNKKSTRVMAVLNPLKITLTNYPEDKTEMFSAVNNPEDPESASHDIPFSRTLFIERDDFMEDAPRKFFRLRPEGMVRLKHGYIIQCDEVIKDASGEITELKCTYFPESRSGSDNSGLKVKGVIHYVNAETAVEAEVRLYDRLFKDENPDMKREEGTFIDSLNPDSLETIKAYVEPFLKSANPLDHFQFLRKGYFNVDPDSSPDNLIFNRTVSLRDNWKKK